MDALSHRGPPDAGQDWLPRIRAKVARKVEASPLVRGCAGGGSYPRILFGGFWHFVKAFPEIIRQTYADLPGPVADAATRRFLKRAAPALSGSLQAMENDERTHRALWLRAAARVGLSQGQLDQWEVLAEVRALTDVIREEPQPGRRLLYFIGVEMVAENLSHCLVGAPRFVEAMGEEGMQWFAAHLVAPGQTSAHEALAFRLALSARRVTSAPVDEPSVDKEIQRCVDWFCAAGVACARDHEAAG